jgi:hypothetical protein
MKSYRIFRLLSEVLVVSLFPFYVFADEEYEDGCRNEEYIEETQIDESVNQSLIDYLESLENQEPAPSENCVLPEQVSDEEIYRQWYQDELENRVNSDYIPEGETGNSKSGPTGFYSIGSDIYYTDPVTEVRYCNTTLTYEHIVFTFGSDYKVTSIVPQYAYFSNRRVKVLLEAFNQIGKPYMLPSNVPNYFTCGSFVAYVFLESLGVHMRTGSGQQIEDIENGHTCIDNNTAIRLTPEIITETDLLPGDVIYWYSPSCATGNVFCPFFSDHPSPCPLYHGIHHSAIYIGNGQVVEAAHNNSVSGVIVGDIRDMTASGLYIYACVRYINEEVTLPEVTGIATRPAGKYKVTIEWPVNKYTDGYLIYSRKNGVYSYCGMTRDKIDIDPDDQIEVLGSRFTDMNALSSGNGYYVFPYVTDYGGVLYPGDESIMVTGEGICLPVTNLNLSPNPGSITLSWDANPEADGYLIYGYSHGQPYGYIGMTQVLVDPEFTDTAASSVIDNHYWVFAYYIENNQIIPGLPSVEIKGRAS